jgi:hypothetical protein
VQHRLTQAVALASLVIALAARCAADNSAGANSAVGRLRPDQGVVLPADQAVRAIDPCSRAIPAGLSEHWTPNRTEIDRLERRLLDVLGRTLARVVLEGGEARPAPADYYRQYAGFHRAGRRVIYVNGIHRTVVERSGPAWLSEALGLCDGGLAGFGVVYDVEADSFGPVEFDGRYSGPVRVR